MVFNTEIMKFSEEIKKLRDSNRLIIVEGKKDQESMNKLGLDNVITINKPIFKIIDSINEKEVVLLTDLDKTGRKLYSELKHNLQKKGIKIDNNFRNFLIKETRLTNIEGIITYLNKINLKVNP